MSQSGKDAQTLGEAEERMTKCHRDMLLLHYRMRQARRPFANHAT